MGSGTTSGQLPQRAAARTHHPSNKTPQNEDIGEPSGGDLPPDHRNPAFAGGSARVGVTTLPPHRPYDCAIELQPAIPPRGRIFSLSRPDRAAMEKYLTESLAVGIICPSSSPAGAGFFFMGKKDGTLRPCIDYRGINAMTVRNRYPLPLMDTAFVLLQGATIFMKLDLRNTYHLVRIREGDEWKTAFNTPTGNWEYLVMPFGLTNAPAIFQTLVNDVLGDMLSKFVFVYLDDILIFSQDTRSHQGHVRKVLQRLLENRMFVKAEKCTFSCTSTTSSPQEASPWTRRRCVRWSSGRTPRTVSLCRDSWGSPIFTGGLLGTIAPSPHPSPT